MRTLLLSALLLAAGCEEGGDDTVYGSTDIRVDAGGETDDPDSVGTRMCVDSTGVVYMVWSDDRDGTSDIWLNRSNDAGRNFMTAAVRVNATQGSVSENPDVACTDNGVYVVWEDDRDGELENKNIYFNYSTDGGQTFQEVDTNLDADDEGDTISKGPRIDATGDRVHVVWFDDVNGAYDIFAATSGDGGASFGAPVRVDSDDEGDAYSAWPELVAAPGGYLYVAWEDSRDGDSDIYFSVSTDSGASFTSDLRIDLGDEVGENDSFEPRLAAEDGVVYVVWHDDRNGARDVYTNYSSDNGRSWASDAERVDSDNAGFFDSLYPSVAVQDGAAHIAWMDARNAGFDIYYRQHDGAAFTAEEQRLDTDSRGSANSIYPVIATSPDYIVVAWEDLRNDTSEVGYNDLYYNYSADFGETFRSDDLRLDSWESGTKYTEDLAIAIHRQEVMAGWTDGRRGSDDVFFTHLTIGEESSYVAPPAE